MRQFIDKTRVFFEHLSSTTTQESLEAYLSKDYCIKSCKIPSDKGNNRDYAIVIFSDVTCVDKLMQNRPHRIDGAKVEVYRSVPGQGSLKDKKGVTNLIVIGIKDKLSESDLKTYFNMYGKIINSYMDEENDCCQIEFDNYDSVDKALLDTPYMIHSVPVSLTKGNRHYPRTTTSEISSGIKYCIHISNIPSHLDADCLSRVFDGWPVHNILMRPSVKKHSLTECWLLDISSQQKAEEFFNRWNRQPIAESRVTYSIEEDKTGLCKYFQIDNCRRSDGKCDWEHIKCPEYRTCSIPTCPYGHQNGAMKTWQDLHKPYQIKITGFQTELTPQKLAQLLNYSIESNCRISRFDNQVAYIVNLINIKSAKCLIEKWCNTKMDNIHQLKYQLELNISDATNQNRSYPYTTSSQSSGCMTENSPDSSLSRDSNDSSQPKNGNNKYANMTQLCRKLTERPEFNVETNESKVSFTNSKLQLPNGDLPDKWEVTKKAEEGEQVIFIREEANRKHFAVIKIYQNQNIKDYHKELQALTILQGTNNVSQLIEYSFNKNSPWIIMERAGRYSLAQFFGRNGRYDLNILEAIQLVQQLLIIVKHVHSQGIFHRNLEPEHIMIEWNSTNTPIQQAHLTLINFSRAYINSDENSFIDSQSKQSWYRPPQTHAQQLQYIPSIDTSTLCAILLWLITNVVPQHSDDNEILPHQQDNARSDLEKKVIQMGENENSTRKKSIDIEQLKKYLYDTFNIAFGYPQYQPWTIDDLEVRLECIRELLLPSNPNLITLQDVTQELFAIDYPSIPVVSAETCLHQSIFDKAAHAFSKAKTRFLISNPNQYSWSDGTRTCLQNSYNIINERQHQDILSYHTWNQNISRSWSLIIICIASVSDGGNVVTLSIDSLVNGKMNRIPIGQYSKGQNYVEEFEGKFINELKYLLISIGKQRKALQEQ